MQSIWKFSIPVRELTDVVKFEMPKKLRILSVGNQNECLCIWAHVDTLSEKVVRHFSVLGTGHPYIPKTGDVLFLGTVQFDGGGLVLHIFDLG